MSSAARTPICSLLLLACLFTWSGAAAAEDADERDLEPIPRFVVFTDPALGQPALDPKTDEEIRGEIQRAFASLGTVVIARERLVKRYGLVCVPALVDVLAQDKNETEVMNAALTVAALRDIDGSAFELLPALRPLVKVLGGGGAGHKRAMIALAVGSFHHHQATLPARYGDKPMPGNSVPGVELQHRRAVAALRDGRRVLARYLDDPLPFLRIAATFALAKMGGDEAAAAFLASSPEAANPQPRRAWLLANAFLGAPEAKPFERKLLGVETKAAQTNEEATAALAMAVAMLQERAPDWTRNTERMLKHLRGTGVALPAAEAERIFAQGICAEMNQANEAWDDVWTTATRASADEQVAAAACQILVHCKLPRIEELLIESAIAPSKALQSPVLALVLLRAAAAGNSEALPKLAEWLRSRSRRPAPNSRWDPRWYVIIGLLRALHEGRIKPQAERALVVDALRRAAGGTLDKEAAIRAPLQALLDVHGRKLIAAKESALYQLREEHIAPVERSFTCRYGLLSGDPIEACAHRVNEMVREIFGLKNVPAWKAGQDNSKYQPQRYLKRYLERYPYFSRLEFLQERGRRAGPGLRPDEDGIDR